MQEQINSLLFLTHENKRDISSVEQSDHTTFIAKNYDLLPTHKSIWYKESNKKYWLYTTTYIPSIYNARYGL